MAMLIGSALAVESCAAASLCTSTKAETGEEQLLVCELLSKLITIPRSHQQVTRSFLYILCEHLKLELCSVAILWPPEVE